MGVVLDHRCQTTVSTVLTLAEWPGWLPEQTSGQARRNTRTKEVIAVIPSNGRPPDARPLPGEMPGDQRRPASVRRRQEAGLGGSSGPISHLPTARTHAGVATRQPAAARMPAPNQATRAQAPPHQRFGTARRNPPSRAGSHLESPLKPGKPVLTAERLSTLEGQWPVSAQKPHRTRCCNTIE